MHKNKTICVEFYSNKFTSNDEISSTKDSQNYLCDGDLVNFCDGNNLKIVVENIQKTKRTKKIENTTHCSDFDRIDYYYNTYKNDIKTIKNYYTANSNNEKIIFHIINENN
ncbi:MAG: hypothetical protein CVV44_12575 [Spirochaetae bacterium HGW-Spirochaetae-1]|jgi:hypothetical protein|nr:MAG: hypothetical protein CVV44_12575 [Spirochaetae bacterium HGW-Spirochaetae-1]